MPSQWSARAGTLTAVVRSSEMRAGVAAACLAPAVRSSSRWLSGWISAGSSLSSPGFLSLDNFYSAPQIPSRFRFFLLDGITVSLEIMPHSQFFY